MNQNFNLKSFSGAAALMVAIGSCSATEHSPTKPNIIIILADDMGFSDIGCFGSEIHTPNLDELAKEGVRFSQFYNGARCCPTRASLLTGLYAHQTGIGRMVHDNGLVGYRGNLNNHCMTIAQVLKNSGYSTYMTGKWHVTDQMGQWDGNEKMTSKQNWPIQRGFDRFWGTILGAGSYYDPITLTDGNNPIQPEKELFYYTDEISSHTVKFIREHQQNNPFFMYVAYTSPHWPLQALSEDIQKYKGQYDGGWDQLRNERMKRMKDIGIIDSKWKLSERDSHISPWENVKDKTWESRRMEVYAAQIDRMDQGIAQIIETLKETKQLDNTIIMFIADNGGCAEELAESTHGIFVPKKTRNGGKIQVGNNDHNTLAGPEETFQSYGLNWANASNTPFRLYKHYVHEGGISSPFIVFWKDHIKNQGSIIKEPTHIIDIMATCVEAASADYPLTNQGDSIIPMQGISLLPVLKGNRIKRSKPLFWEHEFNRAIRDGKWKLVQIHDSPELNIDQWELYDMDKDRTETNNLAWKYPKRVIEMAKSWETWAKQTHVIPQPEH